MIKKAYVLLIFTVASLLLIACSDNKEEKLNRIMKWAIKDGKKVELQTSYNISDEITGYRLTIYNDDKLYKKCSFNKKKKLESYITYEYKNGKITKEFKFLHSGELLNTRYNKYDEHKKLLEYYDEFPGTQEYFYITRCEYSLDGKLIKTKEYQNLIKESNLYSYDDYEYEDNQLIVVRNYLYSYGDKKGTIRFYYENEYNDEGKVSKTCYYNGKGELTQYNVIEYQ